MCRRKVGKKEEPEQRHLSDFVSNDISKKSMGLQKLKAKIYYYNFGPLLPNGYFTSCLYGVWATLHPLMDYSSCLQRIFSRVYKIYHFQYHIY